MSKLIMIPLLLLVLFMPLTYGQSLNVSIEIPEITISPYHKPYVAVWLETPSRQGVHTLAFWQEQSDWHKDLRQWWRKIGRRKSPNYDGVTAATRKPGHYKLSWQGDLISGQKIQPGNYILHIEAVREQGSREYLRQAISLGLNKQQNHQLRGTTELGSIKISIK